jgi:hypothetical protein
MRIIAILLLAALSAGCSKSKDEFDRNLPGTWEWTSEVPNMASSAIITPQSTGIVEFLIFDSKNHFEIIRNGVTAQEGTYTVSAPQRNNSLTVRQITFRASSSSTDNTTFYYMEDDKLTFSRDYGGGLGSSMRFYERR